MPNVGIIYVTFARDREWIKYSLQSLYKYAHGFQQVSIVVPTFDRKLFQGLESEFSTAACPLKVRDFIEMPGKGFVHHLAIKCYADVLMPEADYALHMDPDCLFSAPVTPEEYFVEGKPVLLIEPYESLRETHPARFNWKTGTEAALGYECPYETMVRHPAVHHKWLYGSMRERIEYVHQTCFVDYVLKQKNTFPMGFGEFNTLGAHAHRAFADSYKFIDVSLNPRPPDKVRQFWSYTGAGKHIPEISSILG